MKKSPTINGSLKASYPLNKESIPCVFAEDAFFIDERENGSAGLPICERWTGFAIVGLNLRSLREICGRSTLNTEKSTATTIAVREKR